MEKWVDTQTSRTTYGPCPRHPIVHFRTLSMSILRLLAPQSSSASLPHTLSKFHFLPDAPFSRETKNLLGHGLTWVRTREFLPLVLRVVT